MKFTGGVLDGREFEVDEPWLHVPVANGEWVDPPDLVVKRYQVYVRNGDIYEFRKEVNLGKSESEVIKHGE